jgi:hypothetical protein
LKVLFLEGLPGTGKSTGAHHLAEGLVARGFLVNAPQEMDPENPLHVGTLDEMGAAMTDIHLTYTPEQFAALALDRYRTLDPLEALFLFESFPFQSHVRVLLQMNAELTLIHEFWSNLQDVLDPLDPGLIYFESPDAAAAIGAAFSLRGQEWTQYVVSALEGTAFAQARGLSGIDCALQMFRVYGALLPELVGSWRFKRLVLPARTTSFEERDRLLLEWSLQVSG